jgi:hypothetical protein
LHGENIFAMSSLSPTPTLVWVHATRAGVPSIDASSVMSLFHGWRHYLEKLTGAPIAEIQVSDPAVIERIRYASGR